MQPNVSPTSLVSIILAAGHGKRMHTELPKMMHQVAGKPMIFYPVEMSLRAGAHLAIVVVGYQRQLISSYLQATFEKRVALAVQQEQKGTAHATIQALERLPPNTENVLILCGDTPLLQSQILGELVHTFQQHPQSKLAMLTCTVNDPTGYGRILRDKSGHVEQVREHRDLQTNDQHAVREINPGVYIVRSDFLRNSLHAIDSSNTQGEYYLTDLVHIASRDSTVIDLQASWQSLVGVNDLLQLAKVNSYMQRRLIDAFRQNGVVIVDGAWVDFDVYIQPDARIEKGAVLRGTTTVGKGAVIDVGCVIDSSTIQPNVQLGAYSVIRNATIQAGEIIAPMTYIDHR